MGDVIEPLKIEGLKDFQAALRDAEEGLQKQLRVVFNEAADAVVASARPFIPRRSGRLAGTLKASSGQREASVKLGGVKTPYAGFIEFGGRVGRRRSVIRRFVPGGRSLYPAVQREEGQLTDIMARGLERLADEAGL